MLEEKSAQPQVHIHPSKPIEPIIFQKNGTPKKSLLASDLSKLNRVMFETCPIVFPSFLFSFWQSVASKSKSGHIHTCP